MKKKQTQPQVSDILSEQPIQEEQPKVISHYLAQEINITHDKVYVSYKTFYNDGSSDDQPINKTYDRFNALSPFKPELILNQQFRAIRVLEDNIPYIFITEDILHTNTSFWNFDTLTSILF